MERSAHTPRTTNRLPDLNPARYAPPKLMPLEYTRMRRIPRTVSALALAGSLVLLPVSGVIHAASPTSKVAAKVHETSARINLTAEYIAGVLGIPVATLQQDLQAGQTILQIAGSKYSSA